MEEYLDDGAVAVEQGLVEQDDGGFGATANMIELCRIVAGRQILYNKQHKDYSNPQLKARAWAAVGRALPQPLSGKDAAHAFFKLRQRFGRLRRKVRNSIPRSGPGAGVATYVPDWPYYNELLYLAPVIRPRHRPMHIMKKKTPTGVANPVITQFIGGTDPGRGRSLLVLRTPQSSTPVGIAASNLVFQMPDLKPSVTSVNNLPSTSTCEEEIEYDTGTSETVEVQVAPEETLKFSSFEEHSAEDFHSRESHDSASGFPSQTVPEHDYSMSHWREMEHLYKNMQQSYDGVFKLAKSLSVALQKTVGTSGSSTDADSTSSPHFPAPSAFSSFTPAVQNMLTTLGFAISKVPEDQQLSCLIELLRLVNANYINKQ